MLKLFYMLLCLAGARGWHDLTNADFHCWPLTASANNPDAISYCPGVHFEWVQAPPSEIKADKVFNVSYVMEFEDQFWNWAVASEYKVFQYLGISNAGDAKSWCIDTQCPDEKGKVAKDNCCFHHINIHSCPLTDTDYCGPWLKPSGKTYTHSDVLWGPGNLDDLPVNHTQSFKPGTFKAYWESTINGLHVEGVTQIIAHVKFADMQMALFFDVKVLPKTVCGDDVCEVEEGLESCSTCPADCGQCPLTQEEVAAIAVSAVFVVLVICITLGYFRWKQQKLLWDESWIISPEHLQQVMQHVNTMMESQLLSQMLDKVSNASNPAGSKLGVANDDDGTGKDKLASNAAKRQLFTETVVYGGRRLALRRVTKKDFSLTKDVRIEVRDLRSLQHPNLTLFMGACITPPDFCILTEYCPKGSLTDVLQNEDIPLNWAFRFSLATDVARGMLHLHQNKMVHGNLKSNNCVVDDRWTLKVTDYGIPTLRQDDGLDDEFANNRSKVYQAPEVLDGTSEMTPQADAYAFGVILIEIATRNDPYGDESPETVPEGWQPPVPDLKDGEDDPDSACPSPKEYGDLIKLCLNVHLEQRPGFDVIKKTLIRINPSKSSPVDMMMAMMEKYSKHLESIVADRTQDLIAEKQKTDRLLYSMLPRAIADDLKQGNVISAEQFSACTIYFSDIVGFTSISGGSTPMEVVGLLNKLYTCFDSIIDEHDVYKVETIGDAYMVVSGVPVRNEDRHVVEITNMSLNLVYAAKKFVIPHMPTTPLKIRVGVHTGPVCAGVVGLKMPRYCLFGDTVNTASRMESNGEAYKIHMSDPTHELLKATGLYVSTKRGTIPVKGKGDMTTWWLLGKKDSDDLLLE